MRSAAAPAAQPPVSSIICPTFSRFKNSVFAAPKLLLKRMSFFRRLSFGSGAFEPASAPIPPPQSSPESNWSQTWYSKRSQNITDDAVISVVLPSLQSLSHSLLCVSLGHNSIGDDGAVSLSVVVAGCRLLRRLDIADNRIGSRGAIALSKIFDSCSAISEVVFSENPFADAGGCAIAAALRQCARPNVQLLLMSHCELSSSSIQELAAAICVQSKIISLDLSRNDINSTGAECLSESLAEHTSIQNVDLSHNHIGDDGIVAVSQCLSSRNFSIKCIGLENNGINTSGAVQFLTLLHSRKGLDFISLGLRYPCGTLQSVVRSDPCGTLQSVRSSTKVSSEVAKPYAECASYSSATLASVCLDSAFIDQSGGGLHDAFRSGLCEAAVVIVCLTPRYVTRPNCLKEFQWALDLHDKKRFSVLFLPLHPALSYEALPSLLEHKKVYVSAKDDSKCALFPLCELALDLLNRYKLEHQGLKGWTEMKAWLSDSPCDGFDDAVLATEVRRLVSKFPDLAVECDAAENVALCKDLNEELKKGKFNSVVMRDGISKKDASQFVLLNLFSPGIYPEESAARFFWSFSELLELREAGVFARFNWRDFHVTVLPHFAANAKSNDDVSFQIQCQSIGANAPWCASVRVSALPITLPHADLKLLRSDSPPCEDPKSMDNILLSAILLPTGTRIDKIRVEAAKRERWLQVLRKLSVHETRVAAVQAQPSRQTQSRAAACDLYISTCRRASVSAGRDMQLYLNAIMDSMTRVVASQAPAVKITFRFGNFMDESSADAAASAKTRVFILTDDIALALREDAKRCHCEGCREMYDHVDVITGTTTPATCFVLAQRPKGNNAALQVLKQSTIRDVSFAGLVISDCLPLEAYVEGASLDSSIQRLLQAHQAIQSMIKQQIENGEQIKKKVLNISKDDILFSTNFEPISGNSGFMRKGIWNGVPVAVNTVRNHFSTKEDLQNFARLVHTINHPNCVRLYAVCYTETQQSLVMEWMEGGNLFSLLQQKPQPPMHRRISLYRQICAGLNYLHTQKNIIHSDIKAANILLSADGKTAKIADFGLSKIKLQGAYMNSANIAGTINYLAPEIILNNAPSDRSSDIYAMGCMLWEIATCSVIWDGMVMPDVFAALMRGERPEIPADVDPELASIIEICWAADAALRPNALDLWRRISALDFNNPELNKPLDPYDSTFVPTCLTLEDCLRKALEPATYSSLLLDLHLVDSKYREQSLQAIVHERGLTEVEAKCIIIYTMESKRVSRHQQLYRLFCQTYRKRNEESLDAFADFSFHFWNGLSKLPDHALPLYRGLDKRLADINDLYHEGNTVHWHYPTSCTTDKAVASRFSNGGTLLSLENVANAKCIQEFSLIPTVREFLVDFTATFAVAIALTCEKAKALNKFRNDFPPDVDLVVLTAKAPASSHFFPSFSGVSSPSGLGNP